MLKFNLLQKFILVYCEAGIVCAGGCFATGKIR